MVLPEIAILILPGCSEIKKKIICCLFDYLSIKIVSCIGFAFSSIWLDWASYPRLLKIPNHHPPPPPQKKKIKTHLNKGFPREVTSFRWYKGAAINAKTSLELPSAIFRKSIKVEDV